MKKTLIAISILTILFYACKQEDVINAPSLTSTQASQDNLLAENIFNELEHITEAGFRNNAISKNDPNYTLMNADSSDIDTLIINFGNETSLYDGKLRSGKIIVTYTGKYRDSGSVMTTTFDDYHVNHNLIQGTKTVTNQGINDNGNLWFTINTNNASITTPQNGTINWESNKEREWISGQDTYEILDDIYQITGNGNGNGGNGNDFTMNITTPLQVDPNCFPCVIKSGTVEISPNGYPTRLINYGDSLCDCNVDIIINGTTYPIVIIN